MPEPINGSEPQKNAFGEEVKPIETGGEGAGGEGEGEKGKSGEKLTPTQQIAELSRQLGEYSQKEKGWGETNTSKDDNIRAMAAKIKALESQAKEGKGGGGEGGDELFKEIKTSKDLTAEQKEEMTDTEIKQMDEIAALKSGMNNLATLIKKGQTKEGGEIDTQGIVKDTARDLAAGNKELANQIIESVKQFVLDGLDEEQIIARVGKAATLVSGYKPPKEQPAGGKGKPAGGTGDSDPYGVDKIVEEVHAQKENKGFAL